MGDWQRIVSGTWNLRLSCVAGTDEKARALKVALLGAGLFLLTPERTKAQEQARLPSDPEPEGVVSEQLEELDAMSLEQVLDVKIAVPAALTRLRRPEAPSAVTVITADQIRSTPARNLYDLIEVYVPGALWLNQEDGPHLAVRGSVSRNFRYLLLVNGRVLNSKAHFGAATELEQWDVRDIQRIEIIRGPGSVTYGAGAVAGVISITTHTASSFTGYGVSLRHVYPYASTGGSAQLGLFGRGYSLFVHAGVTQTRGADAPHFIVKNDNRAGFVGEQVPGEPLSYFQDYQDHPQAKLHIDASIGQHWRLWGRYTQDGSTWKGNETQTAFDGDLRNQQGVRHRQAVLTAQYERELAAGLLLHSLVSAASLDAERRQGDERHPTPSHPLNKQVDFSETDLLMRAMLRWQLARWFELAGGAEYAVDYYGPGWFDSARDMRLGGNGVIVNGPSSRAIDPDSRGSADDDGDAVFAGKGWFTHTGSLFSEAQLEPARWFKLLASVRFDRSNYSDSLVSPRGALITEPKRGHFLKLLAQRSLRMNTAAELYHAERTGRGGSNDERLDSLELEYTMLPWEPLLLSARTFLTSSRVITWDADRNQNLPIGDLKAIGVELESEAQLDRAQVGGSYSFTTQLDWELAPGVRESGVSYADYDLPLEDLGTSIRGVGNALNNWPRQALKLYGRVRLFDQLTLHADARCLWDFRGGEDGLDALWRAVRGTELEPDVAASIRRLRRENVFQPDFRLNLALAYAPRAGVTIRLFSQNLLGTNGNKRYAVDSGHDRPAPQKVRFVEEPRTFGASVELQL
jgi:outer membrane receptor protein involved in Fe transport